MELDMGFTRKPEKRPVANVIGYLNDTILLIEHITRLKNYTPQAIRHDLLFTIGRLYEIVPSKDEKFRRRLARANELRKLYEGSQRPDPEVLFWDMH